VGDHGNVGDASKYFGKRWNDFHLNMVHVPLLFHAPGGDLVGIDSSYCSIMDLFPTIASLKNIRTKHARNGISLFTDTVRNGLFYMLHDARLIGWHNRESAFVRPLNLMLKDPVVYKTKNNKTQIEQMALQAYELYKRQLKESMKSDVQLIQDGP